MKVFEHYTVRPYLKVHPSHFRQDKLLHASKGLFVPFAHPINLHSTYTRGQTLIGRGSFEF